MPSESSGQANPVKDAQLDLSVATIGAVVGTTFASSPLGVVAGALMPSLMKLGVKLYERNGDRRRDRAGQALETAADILGGINILEERASAYDDRLELLSRVIEASARTPLEQKVIALGRALAEGLGEDARVNEAYILVAALADIEAPHVTLLDFMNSHRTPPREFWRPTQEEDPRGWEVEQLTKALPGVALVLDGLVATLASNGLIKTQGDNTWGGIGSSSAYQITPLGQRCLFLLDDQAKE